MTGILVVNDSLPNAAPLFAAAGRLVEGNEGSIVGLAPPTTGCVAAWTAWAGHPVQAISVTHLDATTVLDVADQITSDLLIIGSGCRAGREHMPGPALTEAVALGTTRPVLLLREGMSLRMPQLDRPFRTLIPVDGSTVAEGILAAAATLTTAFAGEAGGELHLVQVVHGVFGTLPTHRETMLPPDTQARWYLDQLAERVRALVLSSITVSHHVEPAHDVAEALLRELGVYPREEGTPVRSWDLLAMGVLGPTGHEPYDQSSVVNRVLHATTLPLLVQCQRTTPDHASPLADITVLF